ncbi:KptA family-domain-containing protein [Diplogelasinospora grovesii]|uniref:2'-phosphotransferase n=1 Tax=Diplogelasinospora grovesii TaxID=303347 RepID=A0AAN6NGD7_9PEZI|nr:KptA family-domain-containing protein [Diplogelasinospora grovesii]
MEDDDLTHLEEAVAERGSHSSRGGGRGSKRFQRGGGSSPGGAGRRRVVDISRALSRLLRHQADDAGVPLDGEGYAPLDRVLQWGPLKSLSPTFPELLSVVKDSDKQRFALRLSPSANDDDESSTDPKDWLIRANQGHSIKLASDTLLKPLALLLPNQDNGALPEGAVAVPGTVVHGTYFAFWPKILESGGLRPMGRNHVHFSTGLPEDKEGNVISGMRSDAELLIYVDVEASMKDSGAGEETGDGKGGGMKWWISDNGVVLTEGGTDGIVPIKYFKLVTGRKQNVGVLMKDGEKVADLPEGIQIRVPQGKGRSGGGRGGGHRGGSRGGRGRGRGGINN